MDTHCQYHEPNREIGVMFTSQSPIFHGIFHGIFRLSQRISHFQSFFPNFPCFPTFKAIPLATRPCRHATPGPMGIPCSSAIHMVEPAALEIDTAAMEF